MSEGTKVKAVILELVAAFPAAFMLDALLVRPLKLGIKDDLDGRSGLSRRRITAALRAYCNSVRYLKAITEGAVRIDLSGEPAGTVTASEAHHAREGLAGLAKARTKGTSKIASSPDVPNAPKGVKVERASRPPDSATPRASENSKRPRVAEAATPGQKRLSLSDLKRAAAARKAK
jgi:ProP effector